MSVSASNAAPRTTYSINGPVYALASAPGYVYAGGAFGLINFSQQNNLARVQYSNGSYLGVDTSWNPGTVGPVYSLAADFTNGLLYVGGGITSLAGNAVQYIGRVRTGDSGTFDSSWLPSFNGQVTNLILNGQNLYALGSFTGVGGMARNGVARLATTLDGTPDAYWNIQTDSPLNSFGASSSQISAGGSFTTINGAARGGFALLENWPMIVPPAVMTLGGFQLGLGTDPGRSCHVQSSVDLLTWTNISSVVLGATNTVFTDTNAANSPQTYYRLVSP